MINIMYPLAMSSHAPSAASVIHYFSLHHNVINLVNEQQQLITLHRSQYGLSPMGWVIRDNDFDIIYDHVLKYQSQSIQQQNGALLFGESILIKPRRQLILSAQIDSTISLNQQRLIEQFKLITRSTGLFGPFNQLIGSGIPADLSPLSEQILLFLTNQPYNLQPYIGLGPGLTPSFDDIIVGIFAVLYTDPILNPLLSRWVKQRINLALEQLTTTVSAAFLNCALQGQFSLNILATIRSIRHYNVNGLATHKLLQYGHTSGVDLLLGIWLGILIQQQFHSQ